jgi:hypothetical protein
LQQRSYAELEDSEDDKSRICKDQAPFSTLAKDKPVALAKTAVEALEDDLEDEIEQSTGFQPAPVLLPRGRLQRNDQHAKCQPNAGLDDLLAGVQRLGLSNSNPHVKQHSTSSTRQADMLLASEAHLPSSSDDDEGDSSEHDSSSSSEEEQPSTSSIPKPSSNSQSPPSKALQRPLKPVSSSNTSSSSRSSTGKQEPAEGSLVLSDPAGRKLVLSPQLHSKLYPHQVWNGEGVEMGHSRHCEVQLLAGKGPEVTYHHTARVYCRSSMQLTVISLMECTAALFISG